MARPRKAQVTPPVNLRDQVRDRLHGNEEVADLVSDAMLDALKAKKFRDVAVKCPECKHCWRHRVSLPDFKTSLDAVSALMEQSSGRPGTEAVGGEQGNTVIMNRLVVYGTADDRVWEILRTADSLAEAKELIRDTLVKNCDAALSKHERNAYGSSGDFFAEKLGLPNMNGVN
jgi:hypothetical protein